MTMADSADERLIVMLEARISEFEKRMMQAERRGTRTYTGLQRGSSRATRQMEADAVRAAGRINQALASVQGQVGVFAKAFAAGLGVGALQGLASAARAAVAEMADLADVADRVGVDVESYQGLAQGLKLAGVNADEADGALQAFVDRLGDAARGEGKLAETMAAAGVSILDQNGQMRATMDILRDYADTVKSAPDAAARMALVTEAFGRGGKAMVLAMAEGGAGIDGMIAQARAAGTVLDESMIRKAAELDDKFDQVGQKISAAFKTGVIEAGYFFDLIERDRDVAAYSDDVARRAVGEGLADALANVPEVSETARAAIESVVNEYADLADEARRLVPALSDASSMMAGLGNSDAAAQLSALAMEVQNASGAFDDGKISGAEYQAELVRVLAKVDATVAGFGELDRARLDGVTGAVQGLYSWIAELPGAIAAAGAEIAALEGVSISAPLNGPAGAPGPTSETVSDLAPGSSPRPRVAPSLLGEGGGGVGGGARRSGGGGGGGGGNSRLEAVLRDLQTEKEAVAAWYAESLTLISGATDAQLAALGGKHSALERLEAEHQERMRGIQGAAQGGTLANAETFFGAMATLTAAGGQKMAKAARVTAAAEALINTYRAQAQVLADPTLNFWAKLPAMAAIGAAGMGLVSSLGGSGKAKTASGGGVSGGGGATSAPVAQQQSPLVLTLQGLDPRKLYEGAQIIALTDAIQKEFGKRGLQLGWQE